MTPPDGAARPRERERERGRVSAEAAVVLPVLLVVLAMAVWVLAAVGAQLRCVDAAATAARVAARDEPAAEVERAARAVAPAGADVQLLVGEDVVEVRVQARVRPAGGVLSALPALVVSGRAVAAREARAP